MNSLVLHHHLGMGDHIICNGLVRSLLDTNDIIYLLCKEANAPRVLRMFDDDERIIPVSIPDGVDEHLFTADYTASVSMKYLRCGFSTWDAHETFDKVFYRHAEIDYQNRWSRFYLRRDKEAEEKAFKLMNPNQQEFVFVHDDHSRGMNISIRDTKYLVIRNNPSINIFELCILLENAKEIHCMESSIRCLIEHLPKVTCPLYLHSSVRNDGHGRAIIGGSKKTWIDLENII